MKAIKALTSSGTEVYIEVADDVVPIESGVSGGGVAGGRESVTSVARSLDEVGDTIAEVCRSLQNRIQRALESSKPDELTLKFGVKLATEAGLVVASASVESTFQVTAKWNFK